jgi:predicted MFS family arabinose efflux permease
MLSRTLSIYKNSFTGLSRQTWLLSLIMLINRSGTMVVPFMTLYLTNKDMGRSLAEAGTVMGLFGLGAVIGAYFGGRLSDRLGFHKVQLFTLFFGGVMFIVLGQIKSYPLICFCTFALSLVNEAFRPANSSAIAYYSEAKNRTRSYSLNRLAINLGWAVGSSLGGIIASFNYELLFWVDGFTNIGAAILLFYSLNPQLKPQHAQQKQSSGEAPMSAYRDSTYLWFIVLVSLFAFCFFQLFTTIPKYFRDDMHLSERFIGFIMALNGILIAGVEMVTIYYLERRGNYIYYIVAGVLICGLSYLSLMLPGNTKLVALLMIFFITVGEILSMPFMNTYWTSRSNDSNRGQYAALYTMAWAVAQTLGPFIFSNLIEATSFSAAFSVMGSISFFTAVGFYTLRKISVTLK